RLARSETGNARNLPAAEYFPQNVCAAGQPWDFIDGRADDAMADLVGQRRSVDVRIEEVLRLEVRITDGAVEVANQVATLLRPAFGQGVVQVRPQTTGLVQPEAPLEGVVLHGLRAADIPAARVDVRVGARPGLAIECVRKVSHDRKVSPIGADVPARYHHRAPDLPLQIDGGLHSFGTFDVGLNQVIEVFLAARIANHDLLVVLRVLRPFHVTCGDLRGIPA